MSNQKRSLGLYGGIGVIVAVLIIAGFIFANNYFASGKGTITIQIKDAPVELQHLNITIGWARIQGDNGWTNLTLNSNPFYFDLLQLQNVSKTLSSTSVPLGNYSMIELHVLTANATYVDGTDVNLTVPSDTIKVLLDPHINLQSDGRVTVLIDLQADSNATAISHSLNLRPVVQAVVS